MSQLFASGGQNIGFSFNISPSNEHPGLISIRVDWLDLLAVQGTLKSLLQHHSSKASILAQLSLWSNSHIQGFPCGSAGKESTCSVGDLDLIPGLGRYPPEGKGYPPQYSGMENSMDCIVHGVAKSRTSLSDFHFHFLSLSGHYECFPGGASGKEPICQCRRCQRPQFDS